MKNRMVIFAMLLCGALNTSAQQTDTAPKATRQHNLMPIPAAVQFQTGRLKIDSTFAVAVDGFTDDRLLSGIHRMARRLEGRTGFEFSRTTTPDAKTAALVIQCRASGKA